MQRYSGSNQLAFIRTLRKSTMYLLIFIVLLPGCATIKQQAHDESDWFARDKMVHFTASTIISAAVTTQAKNNGNSDCRAAVIGLGFTLTLGAGKEIYDKYKKKTMYSYRDMVWDTAGALTGSLLASGCH